MATKRKYLAFDIETAKLPENDWRSRRPLGISCAATLLADSDEPILWHGGNDPSGAALWVPESQQAQVNRRLRVRGRAGR
jgi:hypothetical protein